MLHNNINENNNTYYFSSISSACSFVLLGLKNNNTVAFCLTYPVPTYPELCHWLFTRDVHG